MSVICCESELIGESITIITDVGFPEEALGDHLVERPDGGHGVPLVVVVEVGLTVFLFLRG